MPTATALARRLCWCVCATVNSTPCGVYNRCCLSLKRWSDRFQFAFRKFFISNLFGNLPQKFEQESKEIFSCLYYFFTNWKFIVPLYSTQKRVIGFSFIRFSSDIIILRLCLMVIRIFCIHAYEVLSLSVFLFK